MPDRKSLFRIIAEPIVAACVLALAVRGVARIYSVPSPSMSPTLLPGDYIVVTRYLSDRPGRGDVVVFRHPAGRDLTVKRVVAIPGDLVDFREGQLRVSGRVLKESYASGGDPMDILPQLVPAGHVFVLGDNRSDSFDSRHWGPLPDSLVVGRARMVLWSSGSRAGTSARVFKWVE